MWSFQDATSCMSWSVSCEVALAWDFGMALSKCLLFSWTEEGMFKLFKCFHKDYVTALIWGKEVCLKYLTQQS